MIVSKSLCAISVMIRKEDTKKSLPIEWLSEVLVLLPNSLK